MVRDWHTQSVMIALAAHTLRDAAAHARAQHKKRRAATHRDVQQALGRLAAQLSDGQRDAVAQAAGCFFCFFFLR